MRNGVWFYILFDHPDVIVRANKQNIGWVSNFFMKDHLIKFLKDNNITIEYGNTQYNCVLDNQVVKIHGDPTRNHNDWVVVLYEGKWCLCHILCFVYVTNIKSFAF